MVGTFQPLVENQEIVDENGKPTQYFIRFIQEKQEDIGTAITEAEAEIIAQSLIDSWASARDINTGFGLSGGGNLSTDRTIALGDPALTDPAADRILFWDDSAGQMDWLTAGSGLTITDKTIAASGGGGGGGGYEASAATVPIVSDFTWVNQGTATAADETNCLSITNDNDGELHCLVRTVPTAPFDVYMRLEPLILSNVTFTSGFFFQGGIVLRDSSDGELITFFITEQRVAGDEQNVYYLNANRWNSPTSASTAILTLYSSHPYKWLRVNVTSTTITFYTSIDGWNWQQVGTETISTFIDTVSQYGIVARSDANASTLLMKVQQFGTTAPT